MGILGFPIGPTGLHAVASPSLCAGLAYGGWPHLAFLPVSPLGVRISFRALCTVAELFFLLLICLRPLVRNERGHFTESPPSAMRSIPTCNPTYSYDCMICGGDTAELPLHSPMLNMPFQPTAEHIVPSRYGCVPFRPAADVCPPARCSCLQFQPTVVAHRSSPL